MERTIDVSTNLSTQVPPDTISVDITIQGVSKNREECTAKYNELLQTIKDALQKNGLPASILKNNKYSVSSHLVNRYKKDGEGDYYVAEKKLKDIFFVPTYLLKSVLKKILSRKSGKHLLHVVMK